MGEHVIDHIVVVMPACNEQVLVGAAVAAVRTAIGRLPSHVTAEVVVVANGCTDNTIAVARRAGSALLVNGIANVGAARALGCAWALGRVAVPDRLWIAATDADSVVPEQWLTNQLRAAEAGYDVYLGTIELTPEDAARHPAWVTEYARRRPDGRHGHMHGANLGMRASVYEAAGGFQHLEVHEDVDLVGRLTAAGGVVMWADAMPVTTSARHASRVRLGVGPDLEASQEGGLVA